MKLGKDFVEAGVTTKRATKVVFCSFEVDSLLPCSSGSQSRDRSSS